MKRAPLTLIGAALVGSIVVVPFFEFPSHSPPRLLDVSSEELQGTVVVPTLDTPIPEGKSAVWCISFQLAWNQFRREIVKGPLELEEAEDVCRRLNEAEAGESDVQAANYYAAAGFARDGFADRVRREMAVRFPQAPPPDFGPDMIAAAYAYLEAGIAFTFPYCESEEPLPFFERGGKETPVASFGIRSKDMASQHRLRKQLRILYVKSAHHDPVEFAIDLCHDSKPYQIVVARVGRKGTLADTMADLEQKIGTAARDREYVFEDNDMLFVPNMDWRISHHFKELERSDPRWTALQITRFRLDRSGATLRSEAQIVWKCAPRCFAFNRPFLLYMKMRGAKSPFFVLWVENAELLTRWED